MALIGINGYISGSNYLVHELRREVNAEFRGQHGEPPLSVPVGLVERVDLRPALRHLGLGGGPTVYVGLIGVCHIDRVGLYALRPIY
jgi:hypothetical protein